MSTPKSNGKTNLRDRIKAKAGKVKASQVVEIDEWGAKIEVRSVTVGEAEVFGATENLGEFMPALLLASCYDPATGERLWTDDDREWIASQPAGIVAPLFAAASKLSGITGVDEAIESGKGAT